MERVLSDIPWRLLWALAGRLAGWGSKNQSISDLQSKMCESDVWARLEARALSVLALAGGRYCRRQSRVRINSGKAISAPHPKSVLVLAQRLRSRENQAEVIVCIVFGNSLVLVEVAFVRISRQHGCEQAGQDGRCNKRERPSERGGSYIADSRYLFSGSKTL